MAIRYNTTNKRQAVNNWWQQTQTLLDLFLNVMANGGHISNPELENALQYLSVRRREFEQMDYPPIAADIYIQLSEALQNIQQSLEYRCDNNSFYAQTRLNMAQANMDAVRFHLIQFGIIS